MIQRIVHILACAATTVVFGCMSVSYSELGSKYESLPEDTPVQVFIAETPDFKVEQIGIVQIEAGSLKKQIEKAKEIAREKGGDIVIQVEREMGVAGRLFIGGDIKSFDIRAFKIARRVREKK